MHRGVSVVIRPIYVDAALEQQLRALPRLGVLDNGRVQRRPSVLVHGMHVRIPLDQQRERLWALDEAGDVQWRLVIAVTHIDHCTGVQQKSGTLGVVLLDGQVEGGGSALPELRSNVGAVIEQQSNALLEAQVSGHVQRSLCVDLRCVWIGAVLQECRDTFHVVAFDGVVQWRASLDAGV